MFIEGVINNLFDSIPDIGIRVIRIHYRMSYSILFDDIEVSDGFSIYYLS